jgi:hypothetical protein
VIGDRAPDLIEPVVGFRSWRIAGAWLRSPYVDVYWTDRAMSARCLRPHAAARPHAAPDQACACGIYVDFDPPHHTTSPLDAVGIVTAWGRIQVHLDGFRAEHVRIEALGVRSGWGGHVNDACRAIAARLGVALVERGELQTAAGEFGSPIPETLRPRAAAA